jgi:hypothetical protein
MQCSCSLNVSQQRQRQKHHNTSHATQKCVVLGQPDSGPNGSDDVTKLDDVRGRGTLELGHIEGTLHKVEARASLVVNQVRHVRTKQRRGAISLWVLWVLRQVVRNGVKLKPATAQTTSVRANEAARGGTAAKRITTHLEGVKVGLNPFQRGHQVVLQRVLVLSGHLALLRQTAAHLHVVRVVILLERLGVLERDLVLRGRT